MKKYRVLGMRKFLATIAGIVLFLAIAAAVIAMDYFFDSLKTKEEHSEDYLAGKAYGYEIGYEQGVSEGDIAREEIETEVMSQYDDIIHTASQKYGWHPEEAVTILEEYIAGEPVSEEDIRTAIAAISYFYYHVDEIYVDYYYD